MAAPVPLPALDDSEPAAPLLVSLLGDPEEAVPAEVLVAVVDVRTPAAFSALVFVGGVISGVLFGTASATLLPPQPLTARPQSTAAEAATAARAAHGRGLRSMEDEGHELRRSERAVGPQPAPAWEPSGPIRLPQVGQSFRSFCACASHHGQKRRFSTAQGRRDSVGANGSILPRISIGSPESRSMYTVPGSASIMTSRPLAWPRTRYRCLALTGGTLPEPVASGRPRPAR